MWNSKPRRGYDDDHVLQQRGSQRSRDVWDTGEWREAGADPGPADPRRQPEDESCEDVTGLRKHLDRHSCHRQVLPRDLSRRLHALQHHLLVHLHLTPQRICTRTIIHRVSMPSWSRILNSSYFLSVARIYYLTKAITWVEICGWIICYSSQMKKHEATGMKCLRIRGLIWEKLPTHDSTSPSRMSKH